METHPGAPIGREAARLAFLLQTGRGMEFSVQPVVSASTMEEEQAELLAGIWEGACCPVPDIRLEVGLELLAHLGGVASASLGTVQ